MTHQQAVDTLAAERYLLDEMTDADRETFEAHYFDCETCAEGLRAAAAMAQGAKAGFAGTGAADNVVPMAGRRTAARKTPWYRSTALPWAAAAALALVAGYDSFWVVPSLRQATLPAALAPVTLRPESRGTETQVLVDAKGGPVSLAIEVNDTPQDGEVTYDLSTVDGRHIASGRAAAPAPGVPLLLVMPSWTLVAPMHYILSVHDAIGTGRSLGEYRFVASARPTSHT
jgi:hypothetical protein